MGQAQTRRISRGFWNSAQDLFAVTVEPATKAAFVHFFLTSAKGKVVLVNDVNARVAELLWSPWKSDTKGFLRVETIQGRGERRSNDNECQQSERCAFHGDRLYHVTVVV